jgi:hypothetical protein
MILACDVTCRRRTAHGARTRDLRIESPVSFRSTSAAGMVGFSRRPRAAAAVAHLLQPRRTPPGCRPGVTYRAENPCGEAGIRTQVLRSSACGLEAQSTPILPLVFLVPSGRVCPRPDGTLWTYSDSNRETCSLQGSCSTRLELQAQGPRAGCCGASGPDRSPGRARRDAPRTGTLTSSRCRGHAARRLYGLTRTPAGRAYGVAAPTGAGTPRRRSASPSSWVSSTVEFSMIGPAPLWVAPAG